MNDLALAVVNTGSHYKERLRRCPRTPKGESPSANTVRQYADWLEKLCRAESGAPHYEGRTFSAVEIRQAAHDVAEYMIQHVREFDQ